MRIYALGCLVAGCGACTGPARPPDDQPVRLRVAAFNGAVRGGNIAAGAAQVPLLAVELEASDENVHIDSLRFELVGTLGPAALTSATLSNLDSNEVLAATGSLSFSDLEVRPDAAQHWLLGADTAPTLARGGTLVARLGAEQVTARTPSQDPARIAAEAAVVGPTVTVAEVGWKSLSVVPRPLGRQQHAMVYDEGAGVVLLFGGAADVANQQPLADTWMWNGAVWQQRLPDNAPPPRDAFALAYDTALGKMVLFGGWDEQSGQTLDDTWVWEGDKGTWDEVNPDTRPPARELAAMAYDPMRRTVLLFGGWATERNNWGMDDLWEWTGSNWLAITPTHRPTPRSAHTMSLDVGRGRIVLFGGYGRDEGFLADTWEWDGSDWTVVAGSGPSPRDAYSLYYDAGRGVSVLFGGQYNLNFLGDTWEWDGAVWRESNLGVSPSARAFHRMVYDPHLGAGILFGGVDNNDIMAGDMGLYGLVVTQ